MAGASCIGSFGIPLGSCIPGLFRASEGMRRREKLSLCKDLLRQTASLLIQQKRKANNPPFTVRVAVVCSLPLSHVYLPESSGFK